ncbi:hypothetical protein PPN52_30150 [Streptomyces sp. JCM 35825]|nr:MULTISPECIES: helix-turn-helix domain-containing protein [Streptomyces]WCL88525.1 hypothetical protein PPN52_30150 [Streptomyces sp. JCM 35825]
MTTASPSSGAQAAREALAVRLTHLRKDAGLPGKGFSARCGWHPAKTTRTRKGAAAPSDADIRTWCAACGADDRADDLIATARAADPRYMERRRLHQGGMRQAQEGWLTLHEQTRHCRVHPSNVPPGFLQIPAFATTLMRQITRFQGTPDDIAEAVAARVARPRFRPAPVGRLRPGPPSPAGAGPYPSASATRPGHRSCPPLHTLRAAVRPKTTAAARGPARTDPAVRQPRVQPALLRRFQERHASLVLDGLLREEPSAMRVRSTVRDGGGQLSFRGVRR